MESVTWLLLKRNTKFWICISIIAIIVALAIIGPYITPYKPDQVIYKEVTIEKIDPFTGKTTYETVYVRSDEGPSPSHIFGLDNMGRDVFTLTVYGIRTSLLIGLIGAAIATLTGVVLGMIAGYFGGLIDSIIDGAVNVLISIPVILIIIVVGTFYITTSGAGSEIRNIIFIGSLIGLLSWHWTARSVRAQVMAIKSSDYVSVSLLNGNSSLKVLIKDVFPNIASYVFLVFVIQLSGAIATTVTIEFLGIKASAWSLFATIQQALQLGGVNKGMWWSWFFPSIIVVALIASLYILVASLDEVFNPRLRKIG